MKTIYESHQYLIDPHTAVASEAVNKLKEELKGCTAILATAHPGKFPQVIKDANLTLHDIPENLSIIFDREEKSYNFPASKELIFNFIVKNNL